MSEESDSASSTGTTCAALGLGLFAAAPFLPGKAVLGARVLGIGLAAYGAYKLAAAGLLTIGDGAKSVAEYVGIATPDTVQGKSSSSPMASVQTSPASPVAVKAATYGRFISPLAGELVQPPGWFGGSFASGYNVRVELWHDGPTSISAIVAVVTVEDPTFGDPGPAQAATPKPIVLPAGGERVQVDLFVPYAFDSYLFNVDVHARLLFGEAYLGDVSFEVDV